MPPEGRTWEPEATIALAVASRLQPPAEPFPAGSRVRLRSTASGRCLDEPAELRRLLLAAESAQVVAGTVAGTVVGRVASTGRYSVAVDGQQGTDHGDAAGVDAAALLHLKADNLVLMP